MDLLKLVASLTLDTTAYQAGIKGALGAAQSFGGKVGNVIGGAMKAGAAAIGAATAAVGAFGVKSVKTGMEFDSAMSQVAATMGLTSDQLVQEMGTASIRGREFYGNLRDYALEVGQYTEYSASQAAEALNYMALAGYKTQDAMSMLPNVLNLASAGALDLGTASDMVTDASSALSLSMEETTELVNKMASASANSNTTVGMLGDAILTVGGTAKDLAGGTTELSTALGILANNGIKASEGGTALRNIILAMIPKSKKAAEAMEAVGFSAYDANGEMRPLNKTFEILALNMKEMSTQERQQILKNIFNKFDLKSANALLAGVTDGFEKLSYTLEASSVDWGKYMTDPWFQGENAMFYMASNAEHWFNDLGENAEQVAGHLTEMYGLTADDATVAAEAMYAALDESASSWDKLEAAIDGAQETAVLFEGKMYSIEEAQEKWGDSIYDTSQGFQVLGAAEQMAMTQMDNLSGSMKLFDSAMEGVKIAVSDKLKEPFRDFVDTTTAGLGKVAGQIREGDINGAFDTIGQTLADLVTKVVELAPQMLKAGGMLLLALGQGLVNNSSQIMSSISDLVGKIVGYVVEGAPKFMDSAAKWMDNLAEGVKNFDFKGAIQTVVSNIVSFLDGDGIQKMLNSGVKLIASLVSGLYQALPQIVIGAGKIIASLFSSLAEAVVTNLPDILAMGGDIIKGVFEGMLAALGSVFEVLQAVFDGIVNGFKSLFGIQSPSTVMMELGGFLVYGLLAGLDGLVESVTGIFSDLLGGLREKWDEIKESAREKFEAVKETIGGAWENVKGAAGTAWDAVKGTVGQKWDEISADTQGKAENVKGNVETAWENIRIATDTRWNAVKAATETVWSNIRNFMTNTMTALQTKVSAVFTAIKVFIENMWNTIKRVTEQLWNTIRSFLFVLWQDLQTKVNTIFAAIKAFIELIWNAINTSTSTIWSGIRSFLNGLWDGLKTKVESIFGAIKDFITSAWNSIKSETERIWGEIKSFLEGIITSIKEAFTKANWLEIGSSIISGIADGIRNGASKIADAARSAAQAALNAAKSLLGISSPSKVMRKQVGAMISEGIALGISDKIPAIEKAMDFAMPQATFSSVGGHYRDSSKGFTQNVTINAPTELSPSEVARQTRIATQNMVLAWGMR